MDLVHLLRLTNHGVSLLARKIECVENRPREIGEIPFRKPTVAGATSSFSNWLKIVPSTAFVFFQNLAANNHSEAIPSKTQTSFSIQLATKKLECLASTCDH